MEIIEKLVALSNVDGHLDSFCQFDGNWYIDKEKTTGKHQGRFHIIVEGSCRVIFKDIEPINLKKGDILFLPYSKEHAFSAYNYNIQDTQITNIQVNGFNKILLPNMYNREQINKNYLEMFCGSVTYNEEFILLKIFEDVNVIKLPIDLFNALVNLIKIDLLSNYKDFINKSTKHLAVLIYTYILINTTYKIVSEKNKKEASNYEKELLTQNNILDGIKDKRIEKSILLMIDNPEHNWTLESLASSINMSKSNFLRVFTTITGLSPIYFLNNIRIQKSKLLLLSTTHRTFTIGRMCGFRNETNFSKAFKNRVGISPINFRKSKLNN